MGIALKTACREPGCPEILEGDYCDDHQEGKRDDQRPPSSRRGYGSRWRKVSRAYRKAHPRCEDPFDRHGDHPPGSATVDHIVPLPEGKKYDWDNLQALCRGCHAKKTRQES